MRDREARLLLELVADCAVTDDRAAFARVVLARLREVIPAEVALMHELDLRADSHTLHGEPADAAPPGYADACRPHAHENPVFAFHTGRRDGRALKESDFTTRRAYHRLTIHQITGRALGVEEQLAFVLSGRGTISAVCLHDRWGRFGEHERSLLDTLRHPLERARAAVVQREESRALLAALGGAVDAGGGAVAVIGARGAIEFLSSAADELLVRFGVRPAALAAVDESTPPARRDGRELRMRRIAIADLDVVLLEERPAPHPALTPREHEVLALVREGLTDGEIAQRLEISPRTVQRHMQNAFDKLGVRTRAGAATRAAAPAHEPAITQ